MSSALRICMLSMSDCESLLLVSFILEYIACNSVWILSVRLKCTSERFAAASRFLFQPSKPLTSLFIDKWSYFRHVSFLVWSSWCCEWWRRYHCLQFVVFVVHWERLQMKKKLCGTGHSETWRKMCDAYKSRSSTWM